MNILTLAQVEQGIKQCIETEFELFKSAQLLGKKRLFEIACSLYLLSIEQRGQAVLIYRTILLSDNDEEGWKTFWDDYQRHHKKLLAGIWLWSDNFFNLYWDTQWGKSIQETQRKNILEWNEAKKQGFYTFFNDKTKQFERIKSNLDHYIITRWAAKLALEEMIRLKEIGYFQQNNLEKLKCAFTTKKGMQLLENYKKENKLKTSPKLKKQYDEFVREQSLADIVDLQEKATREAGRKIERNMLPTELLFFLIKRRLIRFFKKDYEKADLF